MALDTQDVKACREALALLRQETGITDANLTDANATGLNKIETACVRVYESSKKEFLALAKWIKTSSTNAQTALAESDALSAWPSLTRAAFVAYLAKALAIVISGRREDAEMVDSLLKERLAAAFAADFRDGYKNLTTREKEELALVMKAPGLSQTIAAGGASEVVDRLAIFETEADNEVLTEFAWTPASGTATPTTMSAVKSALALAAAKALTAHKLAIWAGASAETCTALWQLYSTRLIHAKVEELDSSLETDTDGVLAELLSNFRRDDPAIPNAYAIYSQRSTTIKAEAVKEVKATLGITAATLDSDNLAAAAANCLAVARLATACGLDASVKQLKMQEYAAKIQEYRKIKLNETLATNTDAVLAELLANFRTDDAGLINAYTVYTQRKSAVITECQNETASTLGTAYSDSDGLMKAAANCLAVARLATACGLDPSVKQLKLQEYAAKIQEYRKIKLNDAIKSSLDSSTSSYNADHAPVLAELVANFKNDDTGLANAFDVYTKRIAAVLSDSSKEVRKTLDLYDKYEEGDDIPEGKLIGDYKPLDEVAQAAVNILTVAKLATACGLDNAFKQLKTQEYTAKIAEWRRHNLNLTLKNSSKPILLELLANFRTDDPGLVNAFDVYTRRYLKTKTEAVNEVAARLGIYATYSEVSDAAQDSYQVTWYLDSDKTSAYEITTKAPGRLATAAVNSLAVALLAPACGLDASIKQLKLQEYQAKLAEARRALLEAALGETTRAKAIKYAPYIERAEAEINAAHGWRTAFVALDKTHPAYAAWCTRCRALLAEANGEEALLAPLAEKYAGQLREARVNDLSNALDDAVSNAVIPFTFAATGENSAVTQRTSTLWKFALAPSMVAKVEHTVSAVTILTHKNATDPNPYQLVLFAKLGDDYTLLAGSKNTVTPSTPYSLLTWHFDDVEVPTGATLICRTLLGFIATEDELEQLFANNPDAAVATDVNPDASPSYTFPAQLSPTMSTTEFSEDAAEFAYWDSGTRHGGITACTRLYKYGANATTLQSTAQKVMRRIFPFVANNAEAPLPFSIEEYTNAVNAASLEAENETRRTINTTLLDALTSSAAEALACAKVAPVMGLDANFAQLRLQEYAAKITEWRKLKLNETLATNTDSVLAELLGNFRSDDAGLINAYTVYTQRATTIKAEATKEVKATLGITAATLDDDDLAKAAANCLAVALLASACGLDPSVKQLKMQEYAAKITEWRKLQLNAALATEDDPLLAELLGNFKSDDAGLINAYGVYENRSTTLKNEASAEIEAAHDWPTFETGSTEGTRLAALKAAAVNARALEKLALATGAGEETARRYQANAIAALRTARAYALEHEAAPSGIAGEVAAVLRPIQDGGEAALPFSLASIGRRVEELLPAARKEIMSAHRWNFARVSIRVCAQPECADGCALVVRPMDAVRIEAVRGQGGTHAEWSMRGEYIAVYGRVEEIIYIRDVENIDEWPPSVRRALVYRLAADIVMPGSSGAQAVQRLNALYERKLSDAAVLDAREGNPGSTARGAPKRSRISDCYGSTFRG